MILCVNIVSDIMCDCNIIKRVLCLKCQKHFVPTYAFNRICPPCQIRNKKISATRVIGSGQRRMGVNGGML